MLTRRGFLKVAGGLSAAAVGLGLYDGETVNPAPKAKAQASELPWPYEKLDVEYTRKLGHLGYYMGLGCSTGAFYGIVSQLQEDVGDPWTLIPMEMMTYGSGGGAGWGATCGALNGAAAAINLAAGGAQGGLVNELFGWYTVTPFPTDESNSTAENEDFLAEGYLEESLVQTVSDSPLCHVSVTKWLKESGHGFDEYRKERCARVVGDTAAKAVELLNAWKDGNFMPEFEHSEATLMCMECHNTSGYEGEGITLGKMECSSCHEPTPMHWKSNRPSNKPPKRPNKP
ncbi:MAG: C-GCAxxG-C-C family (seleno)protein [Halobacteriota archaeon]